MRLHNESNLTVKHKEQLLEMESSGLLAVLRNEITEEIFNEWARKETTIEQRERLFAEGAAVDRLFKRISITATKIKAA